MITVDFCLLQIIAIAADDPKAASLNDVEDVERCADPVSWPVLPLQSRFASASVP